MKREKVIELADKAGFGKYAYEASFIFQEFARLVEQETLERAAKKCEEISGWKAMWDGTGGASYGADVCTQEIRNLKDNHDEE